MDVPYLSAHRTGRREIVDTVEPTVTCLTVRSRTLGCMWIVWIHPNDIGGSINPNRKVKEDPGELYSSTSPPRPALPASKIRRVCRSIGTNRELLGLARRFNFEGTPTTRRQKESSTQQRHEAHVVVCAAGAADTAAGCGD